MAKWRIFQLFAVLAAVKCAFGGQRIVGGSDANIEEYPYQVSMQYNKSHFCGGSVINEHWILTAGHCLDEKLNISLFRIVTGTSLWAVGGDKYTPDLVIVHENYQGTPTKNDIGLVRVVESIKYGDAVQPIELGTTPVPPNTDVILTGWGKTSHPGKPAARLQMAEFKTVELTQCRVNHLPISLLDQPNDRNICAIGKKDTGACHGDSGGPLVKGKIQVGVVSWGRPCAKNVPDVYTAVNAFTKWINKNIASNS